LAVLAMLVGAKAKRPHLAYLLWLLVLVKLVTPPIVTIPIITYWAQPEAAGTLNMLANVSPVITDAGGFDINARAWLVSIWLLGSVVVFAWSLLRVFRFNRLLVRNSESAPRELQIEAQKITSRLGMTAQPEIRTMSARISPLVWWTGGRVRVLIPTMLLDQMEATQWRWVLAHELAHVRRRDYMVRWLEWLACVCFWWNPVVWWAQRNLRAMEEICCDALVISSLKPKPHSYAKSILTAVESLACPAFRPPAMASEINSGGYLERRIKMIVSNNPNRSNLRWLQVCVLLCAMIVLPFGIAFAQDYEAIDKRLKKAVKKGELTWEQADAMMTTLKKMSDKESGNAGDRKIEGERKIIHKTYFTTKIQADKKKRIVLRKKMGEEASYPVIEFEPRKEGEEASYPVIEFEPRIEGEEASYPVIEFVPRKKGEDASYYVIDFGTRKKGGEARLRFIEFKARENGGDDIHENIEVEVRENGEEARHRIIEFKARENGGDDIHENIEIEVREIGKDALHKIIEIEAHINDKDVLHKIIEIKIDENGGETILEIIEFEEQSSSEVSGEEKEARMAVYRAAKEDLSRAQAQIKEMVDSGEASEKVAKIRLREMRQAMADRNERAEERLERVKVKRERAEERRERTKANRERAKAKRERAKTERERDEE